MGKEVLEINSVQDLNRLRSAPTLNERQYNILYEEVSKLILKADWCTIGIMAPSIEKGVSVIRKMESVLNWKAMKLSNSPLTSGPIFLKANQKTGEIHARIEQGLGQGILITCHDFDISIDANTYGPFPLDFF